MTRLPLVARRAEELLGSAVVATAPIAGGDISTATRLRLNDGTTALMKTHPHAPADFFEAEAHGLRWLAEAGGVNVPEVLAVDHECLIVRWVEPGKNNADGAAAFGRALAATHAAGAPTYGLDHDGFIGKLPLWNRPTDTWAEFYASHRVQPYLKVARDRGAISPEDAAVIDGVLPRLGTLVPEEGPARLHGDLWSGNVVFTPDGVMQHGVKAERNLQVPSKAPYSKRFEDAVGQACESASASRWSRPRRCRTCRIFTDCSNRCRSCAGSSLL